MKAAADRSTVTLARYVLIEARRSALPWLAGACLFGAIFLSGFLSQVAITEASALQASVCAALLRACAVFLVAAHVVASVVRESNDKGMELLLALPMARASWFIGKLAGFCCIGILISSLFMLPLLAWSSATAAAAWWMALAAETTMVAAAAMFFATTLGQTVSAIAATAGLYALGRSISAIQAIAGGPLAGDGLSAQAARWLVDALALLLPRLDQIASGDWLVYGAPSLSSLALSLGGLAIYFLLLAAAGLFDFSRRNF